MASLPFVIVIYIFFSKSLAIATLVYISTAGIKVRSIDMAVRSVLPRFYPGAEHRDVNLKVLKVPELEQKVLDATSDEPWGPWKCSFRVSASHKEIGDFNPEYFHVQGAGRRRGAARRPDAIQRGMCPQKTGIINWDAEDLSYYSHNNDYLEICHCYKSIYEIPSIKQDPAKWIPVLRKICWYLVLAPHDLM